MTTKGFYNKTGSQIDEETMAELMGEDVIPKLKPIDWKEFSKNLIDPRQSYDAESGYYDECEHNKNPYECEICGIKRPTKLKITTRKPRPDIYDQLVKEGSISKEAFRDAYQDKELADKIIKDIEGGKGFFKMGGFISKERLHGIMDVAPAFRKKEGSESILIDHIAITDKSRDELAKIWEVDAPVTQREGVSADYIKEEMLKSAKEMYSQTKVNPYVTPNDMEFSPRFGWFLFWGNLIAWGLLLLTFWVMSR